MGFYISVFSILNPVDPLASVSNLYFVVKIIHRANVIALFCPSQKGNSVAAYDHAKVTSCTAAGSVCLVNDQRVLSSRLWTCGGGYLI